ncbi:MAG: L-serine ammonia-lyase, iron-sulfur-dependent, subunit alpha [Geminicoccaceae bacterium]
MPPPHPFASAAELLQICAAEKISIAELVRRNELAMRSEAELSQGLDDIWSVMEGCIERGCRETGLLPGSLRVKRRAKKMHDELCSAPRPPCATRSPCSTGPTSTPLPSTRRTPPVAALSPRTHQWCSRCHPRRPRLLHALRFWVRRMRAANASLTAAAIGMLYKQNAPISAAEVG